MTVVELTVMMSNVSPAAITDIPVVGDTFDVELVDVDCYQVVLPDPFTRSWFHVNEGDAPSVYGHRYHLYNAATANALGVQVSNYGRPITGERTY